MAGSSSKSTPTTVWPYSSFPNAIGCAINREMLILHGIGWCMILIPSYGLMSAITSPIAHNASKAWLSKLSHLQTVITESAVLLSMQAYPSAAEKWSVSGLSRVDPVHYYSHNEWHMETPDLNRIIESCCRRLQWDNEQWKTFKLYLILWWLTNRCQQIAHQRYNKKTPKKTVSREKHT